MQVDNFTCSFTLNDSDSDTDADYRGENGIVRCSQSAIWKMTLWLAEIGLLFLVSSVVIEQRLRFVGNKCEIILLVWQCWTISSINFIFADSEML